MLQITMVSRGLTPFMTRCFADQKRRIAELGGEDACLNAYVFNHTPTPVEQSKLP